MKLKTLQEDTTNDGGVYVMAEISKKSKELIKVFMHKYKIPSPVDTKNLHITIMYSKTPFKKKFKKLSNVDVNVTPIKFDILNINSDDNALVLRVKSKYLNKRFNDAQNAGAKYSYPKYIPHITLSYKSGNFDIKKLNIKEFPEIHLVGEHIEKLNA